MLDDGQELLMLEEVFKIVFVSTSQSALWQHLLQAQIMVSWNLFGSPKSWLELACNINAMIDIPLLDEEQELELILATINQCAETLQSLLPLSFIDTLKCDHLETVQEMKQLLLKQVWGVVMIPGVNMTHWWNMWSMYCWKNMLMVLTWSFFSMWKRRWIDGRSNNALCWKANWNTVASGINVNSGIWKQD